MISVIVPIYNVEKYLDRCIESILQQTYTNFELILVDDGSTDKSGYVCDDIKTKDKRIIVVHKENGGVSSARNTALSIAKGKYVYFCDPDDYLENNLLKELIETMEDEDSDMAVCGYLRDYYMDNVLVRTEEVLDFGRDITGLIKTVIMLHENTLLFMVWNKMFKRSIIVDNAISFPTIKQLEDTSFVYSYLKYSKTISLVQKKLYHYSIFRNGTKTATTKFNEQFWGNGFTCYLCGQELIKAYAQKEETQVESLNKLNERITVHLYSCLCGDVVINLSYSDKGYRFRRAYISKRLKKWKSLGVEEPLKWSKGKTDKIIGMLVKYRMVDFLVLVSYWYSLKQSKILI